jgi:hypothetical protein
MSFSYDDTLPSDADKVRLAIGDVEDMTGKGESLTDEEITAILATYTDLAKAQVVSARRLLAKLRKVTSHSAAGISSSTSEKFRQCLELIKELDNEMAADAQYDALFAEDISLVDAVDNDDSWCGPVFWRGQFDYK